MVQEKSIIAIDSQFTKYDAINKKSSNLPAITINLSLAKTKARHFAHFSRGESNAPLLFFDIFVRFIHKPSNCNLNQFRRPNLI